MLKSEFNFYNSPPFDFCLDFGFIIQFKSVFIVPSDSPLSKKAKDTQDTAFGADLERLFSYMVNKLLTRALDAVIFLTYILPQKALAVNRHVAQNYTPVFVQHDQTKIPERRSARGEN